MGEIIKMRELINITILLCKSYDENEMSIHNIFNKITIDGNKASFYIAAIINAVEYTKKKFSLHFFLVNLEKEQQVYIGEDLFERQEESEKVECVGGIQSIKDKSSQKMSVFQLEDVEFISEGAHEILVYLYEDEDTVNANKYAENGELDKIQDDEKLVATYGFKVEYTKEQKEK